MAGMILHHYARLAWRFTTPVYATAAESLGHGLDSPEARPIAARREPCAGRWARGRSRPGRRLLAGRGPTHPHKRQIAALHEINVVPRRQHPHETPEGQGQKHEQL